MPTYVFPLCTLLPEDCFSRERLLQNRKELFSQTPFARVFRRLLLTGTLPPTLPLSLPPSPFTFMTLIVRHDLPQAQMAQKGLDAAGNSNTDITMTPASDPEVLPCLGCIGYLAELEAEAFDVEYPHTCSLAPGASVTAQLYLLSLVLTSTSSVRVQ